MTPDKEQLAREGAPLVAHYAKWIARHSPAGTDKAGLISDGFLGLMYAIRKYEDGHGATFATYARLRIRGAIMDGIKKDKRRPLTYVAEYDYDLPSSAPSPLATLLKHEEKKQLLDAIFSLPKQRRRAVVLCYFDELSCRAAAKRLHVSESQVRTTCRESIAALRKAVQITVSPST